MHIKDKVTIAVGVMFLFFLGFTWNASAQTCTSKIVKEATPNIFVDSRVTRKLKDGTIQKFDGNKYKIVPRTQKRKKYTPDSDLRNRVIIRTQKRKKYTPKVVTVIERRTKTVIKRKRNKLQLFLGNGPSDSLSSRRTGPLSAQVQSEDENLLGVGYSREIIDINEDLSISIGGQYLTNETLTFSIGVNW